MTKNIPRSHPRYNSLKTREKLANGFHKGLVHETGLIAHGRGEAFDYLLGEQSVSIANEAAKTAAAVLLLANYPVISVNGNVVSLVDEDVIKLSQSVSACIEVNLFHRTKKRINLLIDQLEKAGGTDILGRNASARIHGLQHDRSLCEKVGIFQADVVLVPLEDGDRCQALRNMGKTVITIDLNPLSRTAKTAHVTIVDNVIRAVPNIIQWINDLKEDNEKSLQNIIENWDNTQALLNVLEIMCSKVRKD